MTTTQVWCYLDSLKVKAVSLKLSEEQLMAVKYACDDLFFQAGGSTICPGWWIGGWK